MNPLLDRITFNSEQCSGRPCIRSMRIRVTGVLEILAGEATQEEILADYPYLEAAVIGWLRIGNTTNRAPHAWLEPKWPGVLALIADGQSLDRGALRREPNHLSESEGQCYSGYLSPEKNCRDGKAT